MRVISWNIQWGRGADGVVNLSRIIDRIRALGPADVICLQEVATGFDGLPGGMGEDGLAVLSAAFDEYVAIHGPAVDMPRGDGQRRTFGNLLLSRLPVAAVYRHLLPSPPERDVLSMTRGCIEAVVMSAQGVPVRVLTTHLEYYAPGQRLAQARWLQARQAAVARLAGFPPLEREKAGPFARPEMPVAAVLCGDFNCEPDTLDWQAIVDVRDSESPWCDAWRLRHGDTPHPPSVGLHGADWPDQPYCCDYMFVSRPLAAAVSDVFYDAVTDASDHQPVVIDLDLSLLV
ncbi:MAG: endonuclease [Denitromonas halophila]|nr:MAG: endonuclease [Denitromonas halophila]TVT74828.1 MAG: endonuclease [Denitromonas halophila]